MAQTIIHLDTSFLIRALVAGSGEAGELRGWLAGGAEVGISTVGWTEFLCGPLDLRQLAFATTITGEPVPFLAEDALHSAELFNQTGRRRGSLLDCMIAAVAIRTNASLATSNRADFQRFQGLRLQ